MTLTHSPPPTPPPLLLLLILLLLLLATITITTTTISLALNTYIPFLFFKKKFPRTYNFPSTYFGIEKHTFRFFDKLVPINCIKKNNYHHCEFHAFIFIYIYNKNNILCIIFFTSLTNLSIEHKNN